MKRILPRLIILLALLLPAAGGWSSGPPVVVMHTVTGYRAGAATAGFEVDLQATNPGDSSLTDLMLSLAPMPPFFKGYKTIAVGNLAAHQKRSISLHLEAPPNHGRREVAGRVLHFTGKYRAADGTVQEFLVLSHPGGAQ